MTGFGARSGAYFSMAGSGSSITTPAEKHTNPKPNVLQGSYTKWFPWGAGNTYPQDTVKLIPKTTVLPRAFNHLIKKIYGKGIVPSHVQIDSNGNKKYTPTKDPAILDFFKSNNIRRFMLETITDYVWFGNAFPEVILNKRRTKIVKIFPNEASYCRWQLINEKSNIVENCYVSANWGNPADDEIKTVAALDMYDPQTALYDGNAYKYILDTSFPSPDKYYYQQPVWDGEGMRNWMAIAIEVPIMKLAEYVNAANIQWHVEIPLDYWTNVFSKMSPQPTEAEKKKYIDEELDNMDNFLCGSKNAKKMFISHFGTDPITKKELPGWKITALNRNEADGKHTIDSSAANSEMLFAAGVDPAEIGAGMPGGPYTQSSGGSNKREAYLISTATIQPDRDALTEWAYIIRDFNKWDTSVEFPIIDSVLTTLDQGSGTQKTLG